MPEIPEEALKAAARAIEQALASDEDTLARVALETAAPILAEHIAQRIAEACPWPDAHKVDDLNPACDYADAARVARDTYPPTRTPDQPNATPTGEQP